MYTYEYPRPSVTVDAVLFQKRETLEILLIQRKNDPFQGCWALPGGFVDENEGLLGAAMRELEEETSVKGIDLKQFRAFGDPGRDPRGHTVSVAFTGMVGQESISIEARDDAVAIGWFSVEALPELAFDHLKIIEDVLRENPNK